MSTRNGRMVECFICKSKVYRSLSQINNKNFCSVVCKKKWKKPSHRKGITNAEEYGFEKAMEVSRKKSVAAMGHLAWNKGTKGIMKPNLTSFKKGYKPSVEMNLKRSKSLKKAHSEGRMPTTFKKGETSRFAGRKHTNKSKKKMSLSLTGKRHTENTKIKMSISHKKALAEGRNPTTFKKGQHSMEKNPQWRGGISFEPYGIEFNDDLKLIIRFRDDFVCRECGMTEFFNGRNLNTHHCDYNKKNNAMWNLISLCDNCHKITNGNRNFWTQHFQGRVNN